MDVWNSESQTMDPVHNGETGSANTSLISKISSEIYGAFVIPADIHHSTYHLQLI